MEGTGKPQETEEFLGELYPTADGGGGLGLGLGEVDRGGDNHLLQILEDQYQ